jgi:formylglycine-generating enzyme required for sulfatase activity
MRRRFLAGYFAAYLALMSGDGNGSPAGISIDVPDQIIMVNISAGTFQMGDTDTSVTNQNSQSIPVHRVTLGAFSMAQTLVTQAQYRQVMGVNPSFFDSGGARPVEAVSWFDAVLFCNKLSRLKGLDTVYSYTGIDQCSTYDTLASPTIDYSKNGYRLPTEAEYEYACRAGSATDYYWGRNYPPRTAADTLALDSNAVWYGDSPNLTQPVPCKKPNAWGLYNMSGNVWEWCNDWFGSYDTAARTNPTGAASGKYRVLRGGSIDYLTPFLLSVILCSAYRGVDFPQGGFTYNGFRVVRGAR